MYINSQQPLMQKKVLENICETEQKMIVNKKIPRNSGILVMNINDKFVANEYEHNKFNVNYVSQISYSNCLKLNKNKYGICEKEYAGYAPKWVKKLKQSSNRMSVFSQFSYLEVFYTVYDPSSYSLGEIFPNRFHAGYFRGFVFDDDKVVRLTSVRRLATKESWKSLPDNELVPLWLKHYHADYDKIKDDELISKSDEYLYNAGYGVPVHRAIAPYRLIGEDISTLEDRKKGIRRGRLRLEDRETNEVLAEYVSFDLVPTYISTNLGSYFNCYNLHNEEDLESFDEDYNPLSNYRYFFERVIEE